MAEVYLKTLVNYYNFISNSFCFYLFLSSSLPVDPKPAFHFHFHFSSLSFSSNSHLTPIAHHWTFDSTAPQWNVLLLFQHGTWFCYSTMELASTFAPPQNRLSTKKCRYVLWLVMWCLLFIDLGTLIFLISLFSSLVRRSRHSLWLWFMIEVVVRASCFVLYQTLG